MLEGFIYYNDSYIRMIHILEGDSCIRGIYISKGFIYSGIQIREGFIYLSDLYVRGIHILE